MKRKPSIPIVLLVLFAVFSFTEQWVLFFGLIGLIVIRVIYETGVENGRNKDKSSEQILREFLEGPDDY